MDDERDDQMRIDFEPPDDDSSAPSSEAGVPSADESESESPESGSNSLDASQAEPGRDDLSEMSEGEPGLSSANRFLSDEGLDLPPNYDDRWLFTVKEVARLALYCEKTVRRAIKAGNLEVIRVGGSIRITRAALVAWLNRRKSKGDEA